MKGGGGREDSRIPSAWTPFFSCKKKKNILNAATFPSSLLINTPHIPALKRKVHSIAIILSLPNKIIIPVIRPPRTVPYIHPKIKKSHQPDQLLPPSKKKIQKRENIYAGKNLPINPNRMILFPPPALPNHITPRPNRLFSHKGEGVFHGNRNKLLKENKEGEKKRRLRRVGKEKYKIKKKGRKSERRSDDFFFKLNREGKL